MQRPPILSPLVFALSLHAGHAMALGFGKVSGSTALGHPLSFSVGLRLDPDDRLEPGCVSADVMVGDRPLGADVVRARLVRVGSSGERRIRVTTTVPVEEPTLSVTVRAGCTSTLTRNYVVFADPPQTLARIGDPETDAEAGAEVLSTSPFPAAAGGSPAQRAATANRARPVPTEARAEVAPVRPAATPRRTRPAPAIPPRSARPVLQLDPVEAEDMAQPDLRMSRALGTLPAAPGAASAPPDPELLRQRQDQARLQALEASVRQLREDGLAKERALSALQVQVRDASAERYANPLVYTLAGLCAALGLGLVGVLWLRERDRRQARWWGEVAAVEAEPAEAPVSDTGNDAHLITLSPATTLAPAVPPVPVSSPAPLPPMEVYAVRQEVGGEPAAAEPRRPMSAEELIDLEQQVEFFVVLGQDDAAIDLLMGHVRSTSGVSPLPYLKLLEIYRRREEREPYERIRERFNRRFNAYAPEWGVDPETGFDLEGYPEVLGRVQGIWAMPSMAMELLDTQLFRRDAGPTFDVPAYRELLFLYGIARDLAERDVPASGVDLLLPLGDEEPDTGNGPIVALSPDLSDEPLPEVDRHTLDLDVSTDQPPNLTVELPPDSERGRGFDFHLDEDSLPPPPPRR